MKRVFIDLRHIFAPAVLSLKFVSKILYSNFSFLDFKKSLIDACFRHWMPTKPTLVRGGRLVAIRHSFFFL